MSYKVGDKVLIEGKINKIEYGLDFLVHVDVDGKNIIIEEDKVTSKTYEDGLADAWELARKVNAMSEDEFDKCFNFDWQCTTDFTYQEILAMVEAYEESKAIKVGDVVYANGVQGVVIDIISDDDCYIYDENGCIEVVKFEKINKTGRTVDIEHLLEQIRGNE